MNIHVREISINDAQIINKWHNDRHLYDFLVGDFYGPSIDDTKKWINNYSQCKNKTFRGIVSTNSEDIGVVYLIHNKINSAEVGIFIADENNRSKGYGKLMISWLLKLGFEVLNFENIYLYTLEENERAIKLYNDFGFAEVKNKRNIVTKNGVDKNTIYMQISKKHYLDIK